MPVNCTGKETVMHAEEDRYDCDKRRGLVGMRDTEPDPDYGTTHDWRTLPDGTPVYTS